MPVLKVSVDMNTVETEFPVLSAGEYLSIYDVPVPVSSKQKKPALQMRLRVVNPPVNDLNGKPIKPGAKLSFIETVSLDPNAPYTLKARLIAARVPYKVVNGVTEFNSDDFAARQVHTTVSVYEDPQSKRKYNRVESTRPV